MSHPLGPVTDTASLRALYRELLRAFRPDVCCDVGANDGQAALMSADAVPEARVYAFEANPEIHALHEARLSAAGVRYLNLAVSDRSSDVTVFAPRTLTKMWVDGEMIDAASTEPRDTGKTSLLLRNEPATYAEFTVPSCRLDDFLTERERIAADTRCCLWIDVEGAAATVLEGAGKVLEYTAAIFVELENRLFWKEQRTADYVAGWLAERGFEPLARDREYGDDQFNVLFVHRAYRAVATERMQPRYPQSNLRVIVPTFNNPTPLRRMVAQLISCGLGNIVIVDNGSEFPPMIDDLRRLEPNYQVIRLPGNKGPRHIFADAAFYAQLPQLFCVTDPDLAFNPELPANFLDHLIGLTHRHRIGKAGFALDISTPDLMLQEQFVIGGEPYRIWEWEGHFWQTKLADEGPDPVYRAWIDTTFAICNKEFLRPDDHLDALRVAGRYTARHLPWYRDYRLPADEAAFYRRTSKHSFYT
ncbi:MAG: FkbM family methyltransferase, partial [Verrucomicrobiota bacterium]|nr:FkbM family methyltransferase [Verrucomicrobiota bacterium]